MPIIRKIPQPRGIEGIEGIDKAAWRRPIGEPDDITRTPQGTAPAEDPLEKAAAQGVPGTLPERIVQKWLSDNGYSYTTQNSAFGGARMLGGMTLDFVVYGVAGFPVVLRVQGAWWHGPESSRQHLDDEQSARLRLSGYIVVDLWETDIYRAVKGEALSSYIKQRISM